MAHDGVQQGINASGQVVEHAGNVSHDYVDVVEIWDGVLDVHSRTVNGEEALGVEGSPTKEEGNDDGHCG